MQLIEWIEHWHGPLSMRKAIIENWNGDRRDEGPAFALLLRKTCRWHALWKKYGRAKDEMLTKRQAEGHCPECVRTPVEETASTNKQ